MEKDTKKAVKKEVVKGTAAGVAESIADQAIDNVVPTKAAVHQAASDEIRKIPILGDVLDIGQKAGYAAHLGKLFGRKKKKKE